MLDFANYGWPQWYVLASFVLSALAFIYQRAKEDTPGWMVVSMTIYGTMTAVYIWALHAGGFYG